MTRHNGGTPLLILDNQYARYRATDQEHNPLGGRRILCDHAFCPAARMLEACRQAGATPPIHAKP